MKKAMNETEKVSINLGALELGQIDALVEQGFYSDRSDLIRTAVRAELEKRAPEVKGILEGVGTLAVPGGGEEVPVVLMGVMKLDRAELEPLRRAGKKLVIKMIGSLTVMEDVDPELAAATIKSAKVWGKVRASAEIKALLETL